MSPNLRKDQLVLTCVSALCGLFSLFALWYVASSPDLPVRCVLSEESVAELGLPIRYGPREDDFDGKVLPVPGDRLVSLGGRSIRSFVDYTYVLADLRSRVSSQYGRLNNYASPADLTPDSTYRFVEIENGTRFVHAVFRSHVDGTLHVGWLKVLPQPLTPLAWSVLWLLLQFPIVVLTGLTYWKRPDDQAVKLFFMVSSLALVAYTGGNHWWVLASSPLLTLSFTSAAVLFPAVLLHFFLVYPAPDSQRGSSAVIPLVVYPVPVAAMCSAILCMVMARLLSSDWGPGVLQRGLQGYLSSGSSGLMEILRTGVFGYIGVAAVYFVVSMARLIRSYVGARNPLERAQVQWILWAGIGSSIAICYTLWLAYFRTDDFAFGAARAPMMAASGLFMVAYAVGIARYKLMLVDQVLSRGMWYYVLSVGLTITFGLSIAGVAIAALWREGSGFNDPLPMVFVLTASVLASNWLRDRLQRSIDLRFFREKYPLDKALQRINRSITNVLERRVVADNLLTSCCEALRVDRGALYLVEDDRQRFRLSTVIGRFNLPLQFSEDDSVLQLLMEEVAVQRVPSGASPIQDWLRAHSAEFIQGLESEGQLVGVVVLGAKSNGAAYTGEDVTFITAIGRVTGVALHCAKVHADINRLNEDVQQQARHIAEQERRIAFLQAELSHHVTDPQADGDLTEFRREAIKGTSPAIQGVLETVRKVAASEASVLLRGESGTGKELLARAIHENSPRADGPLVSVHCASLSPTLLESELFGHVKGAFTDARDARVGRFQLAEGGTLFLDEIGDISLETQIKLLRVLQERIIEPVGGSQSIPVDVRVVAATHQNLERLIAEGKFREDLYYRLNVVTITLPPLRERREDLFELALHFLRRAGERTGRRVTSIDETAMRRLTEYNWPGNIRELQNIIERAVVLAEGASLTVAELPAEMREPSTPLLGRRSEEADRPRRRALTVDVLAAPRRILVSGSSDEKSMLEDALQRANGNKADAARLLGMPRSTYYSKLKKHGLD
ncbi:Transcriptional regulatory protein ZraR [Caulifigura coniformis]|uniref:Transcriptional regulatory protein ZraR n=1 Tax=Caulifigura coniformis TaxID=2527983 RepID=A0A517SAV3_9PLAN|nr:sigma-54-dependent Fis family transcriptional regulator [Caulifigura coniformis]QDT53268.1 Transcriptional regulatory protein ZraR [Caulifigura coniformis]